MMWRRHTQILFNRTILEYKNIAMICVLKIKPFIFVRLYDNSKKNMDQRNCCETMIHYSVHEYRKRKNYSLDEIRATIFFSRIALDLIVFLIIYANWSRISVNISINRTFQWRKHYSLLFWLIFEKQNS
jgi:hypothetical protein